MNIKKFAIYISLSIPLILTHMGTTQAAIYRWVDDNGRIHYSDRVAPQDMKKKRYQLNSQGVTQSVTKAAKTPEQLAVEEQAKKDRTTEAKIAAKNKQYDDMLLATFTTDKDLIRSRDGKINALESSIKLTESSLARLNKNLTLLNKKENTKKNKESDIAKKLMTQITDTQAQIQQQEEYIGRKRQEQIQLSNKFDKDIARFRELIEQRDKVSP